MATRRQTRRQTCPPRTDAYAVCSALLDMSVSNSHANAYRASVPPAAEFGHARAWPPVTPHRRPAYNYPRIPVSAVRGVSAPPPGRWSKFRASKAPHAGPKPEHKWVQRLRLGWNRLKTRLATRHPERGVPDVPVSPDKDEVESEEGQGVDWIEEGDEVHIILWDGYWDERDRRSIRSDSSVSIPIFLGSHIPDELFFSSSDLARDRTRGLTRDRDVSENSLVSITVTPPSPRTPRYGDVERTPTPMPRMRNGTPTLFPPSNRRFYQ